MRSRLFILRLILGLAFFGAAYFMSASPTWSRVVLALWGMIFLIMFGCGLAEGKPLKEKDLRDKMYYKPIGIMNGNIYLLQSLGGGTILCETRALGNLKIGTWYVAKDSGNGALLNIVEDKPTNLPQTTLEMLERGQAPRLV